MIIKQSTILNMVANGGISWYKAMRAAGYSHAMARNPQKLTESPQMRKYMEARGITPEKAISSLQQALDTGSVIDRLMVAKFCLLAKL